MSPRYIEGTDINVKSSVTRMNLLQGHLSLVKTTARCNKISAHYFSCYGEMAGQIQKSNARKTWSRNYNQDPLYTCYFISDGP